MATHTVSGHCQTSAKWPHHSQLGTTEFIQEEAVWLMLPGERSLQVPLREGPEPLCADGSGLDASEH